MEDVEKYLSFENGLDFVRYWEEIFSLGNGELGKERYRLIYLIDMI